MGNENAYVRESSNPIYALYAAFIHFGNPSLHM